jgi:hypothetical protein
MTRPATVAQRQQQAAQRPPESPLVLERPAYAADFAEWLVYRFTQVAPEQVPAVLATSFPAPDLVDCAYLETVLRELAQARHCEREVGCGIDFVFGGIEYAAVNVASARQWCKLLKMRLMKADVA